MTATREVRTVADAWRHADRAATNALLRCWSRESRLPVPAPPGELRVPLPACGVTVTAAVRHRSAVGWHLFDAPRLALGGSPEAGTPLEAVTLAALLARQSMADRPEGFVTVTDLVERAAESVRRVAGFLAARADAPDPPHGSDPFLVAEQALLLGHLIHPAPKSRDGLSDNDAASYSPELRGAFALHWFAADPAVVASDAVRANPAMAGRTTPGLLANLAGIAAPPGRVLVPAHPWQAHDLLARPAVRDLVDAGQLEPLGPAGPLWHPTSSLRTVYRPGTAVMLKLSLGLRITNSRRENTPTELVRGVEVHHLLDAGLGAQTAREYPGFRIVRDPGWLAVRASDGGPTHLDVSVREVPGQLPRAQCLAGLVAPHSHAGPSDLVATVRMIARREGRAEASVAAEWVRRYIDRVLAPMVHLYATTGVGLEAHQQNTLVLPDEAGWPAAGWFRDNQGYYLAESGLAGVLRLTGADSSSLAVVDDAIVDDRLTYYLLFNQAFAPVGALGSEGVASEVALLRELRAGLAAIVERGHDSHRGLVARWLHAESLPCKANFATRIAGIDEVLAPLDAQSVYLDVPNPLREVTE